MKTSIITPADRLEANQFRIEIRQRPGWRLARAWADMYLVGQPPTRHSTTVSSVADAIHRSTGARLDVETVAVALEDAGIPLVGLVRYRSGELDGDVSIDETAVLSTLRMTPRPWGRIYSDCEPEEALA